MSKVENIIFKHLTIIDVKNKKIEISGCSLNGDNFTLLVGKNEYGRVDFIGKTPLNYYQDKIFRGGEWKYFDRQLEIYRYILGDTSMINAVIQP